MTKKVPLILQVALPLPIYHLFDYLALEAIDNTDVNPGSRVLVPFGKSEKVGVLIAVSRNSVCSFDTLKPIVKILDEKPLIGKKDLELLFWASEYYHHPLGEVISSAFPALLRKGKPAVLKQNILYCLTENAAQSDFRLRKGAIKQQQLLQIIKKQGRISTSQLTSWNKNWRPLVKTLVAKDILKIAAVQDPLIKRPTEVLRQENLQPNAQQQHAIDEICASLASFKVFLLQGVTGSGKTEVYLQVIQRVLLKGGQIVLLIPEISLTPQLESRFKHRFSVPVAVSHSNLTDKQRQEAWLSFQQGKCSILLGTRSALFVPFQRPGLIILDEEHDASFKQQEGFRFSARDVAVVRAKMLHIPILLGSATPSLESLHNVAKKRYQLLTLSERAGNATQPTIQILDIRNKRLQEGLSEPLIRQMKQVLSRQEQVLIFLNRRGFAPTLICHTCGWVARCPRCDANMVVHFQEKMLRCHHCTKEQPLLTHCHACTSSELKPLGLGTERVAHSLQQLFPAHKVTRLDRDTTQKKGSLQDRLLAIKQQQVDIILGTQMLAKGHHFPNVTLVIILDVDSGLFSIDFHAAEKLAQIVTQVAGRAGRSEKPGRVLLQTRQPGHALLTALVNEGYEKFAKTALKERQQAHLPPFSYQALFRAHAANKEQPELFFQQVSQLIHKLNSSQVLVLGPATAPMAKKAGQYRYQLLLQCNKRKSLHKLLENLLPKITGLKQAKKVRWSLDIDPVDLY